MKAVFVALFALFAVASAGLLASPVAVAPVVHTVPAYRSVVAHAPVAVAAVPAYRSVVAHAPIATYGVGPVGYGLGGVYGGGLAYNGALIG